MIHVCPTCGKEFNCGRECCDGDPNVPCKPCLEARRLIIEWAENIKKYGTMEKPSEA